VRNKTQSGPGTTTRAPQREAVRRTLERLCKRCRFDVRHLTVLPYAVDSGRGAAPAQCHEHETGELAISWHGPLLCQQAGGAVKRYLPGHLVLIPAGLPHVSIQGLMREQASRSRWFTLTISFGSMFMGLAHGRGILSVGLSAEEQRGWKALLGSDPARMFEHVDMVLKRTNEWRSSYLDAYLKLFFLSLAASLRPEDEAHGGEADSVATRVTAFINTHYADAELSLDAIAAAMGMTPHHLTVLFKRQTGTTVWKSLVDIRLTHAHSLVLTSAFPIKEIAARTGWSNQLYFTHTFRRRFGMSPTACRSAALEAPRRPQAIRPGGKRVRSRRQSHREGAGPS
jgi:AraC-like DNA-binding protein